MANPVDRPDIGTLVLDKRHARVGEIMAYEGGRAQLRPPQGGREWESLPEDIEPVDPGRLLSLKPAAVNAQSRETR